MATQVDSLSRSRQLNTFRPWRHRETTTPTGGHAADQDTRPADGMDANMALPAAVQTIHHHISEANAARMRHSQHMLVSSPSQTPGVSSTSTSPSLPHSIPTEKDPFDDSLAATPTTVPAHVLDPDALSDGARPDPLPSSVSTARPSLKRRRALTDVDGPNTAALCCKKRRLRRFLITSRLSQPFSQPATHILNRESVALGDKRFLKLAAVMNARRITRGPSKSSSHAGHPCPSDAVRRAAMANRLRRRIFGQGGRATAHLPVPPLSTPPGTTAAEVASSAVYAQAKDVRPSTAGDMQRSPKLPEKATRETVDDLDALDDDECAFPTSEHETRYDANDEPEDVYADFSVLFNGAAFADGEADDGLDGLDDYMDELDGIAHLPR